ncbi:hypothetical protein AOY86_21850 [Escherichia coli]|nr:hypothetical protein AOY86_21505 [Escherichia coli]UMS05379.1 hypothetical protein AOY86_21685 [Escherichia coli]UMS05391.1 hypothetical protein AOY86_21850 [Escherichia coli]
MIRIIRYVDPHIGIRPTSVKRFSFFAGIKNRWGGQSGRGQATEICPPSLYMSTISNRRRNSALGAHI